MNTFNLFLENLSEMNLGLIGNVCFNPAGGKGSRCC